ncbi:MAG: N-acetyltransferase [Anaerolineaceae bacterium]|nr:MAG: N-acetyltransferase [Anaerolineaceae bacterium]
MADDFLLRPATADDAADIKALIRLVRINPMALDWRRFLLASSADGRLAACVQVKPHADETLELASLAVRPAWRGRGLARRLVEQLLSQSPRPIHLTCRSGLESFYQKFGFRTLAADELTPYFRRLQKLANKMMRFFRDGETLLVMRLDE